MFLSLEKENISAKNFDCLLLLKSKSKEIKIGWNGGSSAGPGDSKVSNMSSCCMPLVAEKVDEGFRNCRGEEAELRVAFGKKYGKEVEGKMFAEMLREFTTLIGVFNIGDFIPWLAWVNYVSGLDSRVEKNFNDIDCFLDKVIEDHIKLKRGNDEGGDGATDRDGQNFVDFLLEIEKDDSNGIIFDKDSIKAMILDSLLNGLCVQILWLRRWSGMFPTNLVIDFHSLSPGMTPIDGIRISTSTFPFPLLSIRQLDFMRLGSL
ncbi:hypothetical protein NE237_008752 [Protea cynaroides]|uniref:Cytochrome P450 n=1 Tax=Protea cynaroides TaxID=273540 RepID=A0A9Q0KWH3_9MAGN|nr:hypothetical protein NE237_008752 [Protea cynaroides]